MIFDCPRCKTAWSVGHDDWDYIPHTSSWRVD